jgi:threonine dehydrogenase-like Zn-dependent dehydrogenase
MRGVVLRAPKDVRVEQHEDPRIQAPTDAIIRVSAACVCGSDLWPYRGVEEAHDRRMGHEYVGIVEEVGDDVRNVKPGVHLHGGPAPVRRFLPELIDLIWHRRIDPARCST